MESQIIHVCFFPCLQASPFRIHRLMRVTSPLLIDTSDSTHLIKSHLISHLEKSKNHQPTNQLNPSQPNQAPLISSEVSSVSALPKWPQRSMISACETNDGANFKLKRCRNVSWVSVEMDSTLKDGVIWGISGPQKMKKPWKPLGFSTKSI